MLACKLLDDLSWPLSCAGNTGENLLRVQSSLAHDTLAEICLADSNCSGNPYLVVDVNDPAVVSEGIDCGSTYAKGAKVMVVKPGQFVPWKHGIVQPAVKCRGPEYLRIIYGPEYDQPEHMYGCASVG